MTITTKTNEAFIEAEVQSQFILRTLNDGLLPNTFYRDITDFPHGKQLNIPKLGDINLQTIKEDTVPDYQPIESGQITFHINKMIGDAYYVTDDMREDSWNVQALLTERSAAQTRALQEKFLSDFLADTYSAMSTADPYTINGFAHKIGSSETNNVISLDHFIAMKVAFNKAKSPHAGRIAIVDSVAEGTLSKLVDISRDVTSFGQGIIERGFTDNTGMRFVMNIHGWDIFVTDYLPTVAALSDGTNSVSNAKPCIFMNILSDNTKPMAGCWRRQPKIETERDIDHRRDKFTMSCRYDFGNQRKDTLGIVGISGTKY